MSFSRSLARGFVRALYDARRELDAQERERASVERFNERWHRLLDIQQKISTDFVEQLEPYFGEMTENESDRLILGINEMCEWQQEIAANIDDAGNSHLSRYATCIKKLAMRAIKLCKKYGVYSDIVSVEYDAKAKMIQINGDEFYYLG